MYNFMFTGWAYKMIHSQLKMHQWLHANLSKVTKIQRET